MSKHFSRIACQFLLAIFLIGLIGSAPVLDKLLDPVNVSFFEPESESLENELESDFDPIQMAYLPGELLFSPELIVFERHQDGDLSATAISIFVVRLRGPPTI